jgi:hypothetical protein
MGKAQAKELRKTFQMSQTGAVRIATGHLQGAHVEERRQTLREISSALDLAETCQEQLVQCRDLNRRPASQKIFVSALLQWITFCTRLGLSPFRWNWFLRDDMSAMQIAQEEGLQMLYVGYLKLRVTGEQTILNYISAVKTFHLDYLTASGGNRKSGHWMRAAACNNNDNNNNNNNNNNHHRPEVHPQAALEVFLPPSHA